MSGMLMAVTNLAADVLWYRKVDLDVGEGPEALLAALEQHFGDGLEEVGAGARVGSTASASACPVTWRSPRPGARRRRGASFPLAERLQARFERPVFVDRDVNFLALGEHRTSWPDARVFLCLKVGTVIACGLIIDGQVVRGATGLLGEIGHTKVHGHDEPCTVRQPRLPEHGRRRRARSPPSCTSTASTSTTRARSPSSPTAACSRPSRRSARRAARSAT